MRKSVVAEMFNCEWEEVKHCECLTGLEGDPSRGRRGSGETGCSNQLHWE